MQTENNSCLSTVYLLSISCNATTLLLKILFAFVSFANTKKNQLFIKNRQKNLGQWTNTKNLLNYSKPLECTCRADFIFPTFCHFPHWNLTNIDFTTTTIHERQAKLYNILNKKADKFGIFVGCILSKNHLILHGICTSEAHF